jgi:hypothetical protein
MFADGSPKTRHHLTVAVGVGAGLVMLVASFWARVTYEFPGGGTTGSLEAGSIFVFVGGFVTAPALLAWHRGYVAGRSVVALAVVLAMTGVAGPAVDWHFGREMAERGAVVYAGPPFYAAVIAAFIASVTSLVILVAPGPERSEASEESWQSRGGASGS